MLEIWSCRVPTVFRIPVDHSGASTYTLQRMQIRKILLFSAAFWQILRFFGLALVSIISLNPDYVVITSVIILWPLTQQILLATGFLMYAIYPVKYVSFRKLLLLGKTLDIFPGLLLLFLLTLRKMSNVVPALIDFEGYFEEFVINESSAVLPNNYLIVIILLIDFIYLFILLSLKQMQTMISEENSQNLPVMQETRLEEE